MKHLFRGRKGGTKVSSPLSASRLVSVLKGNSATIAMLVAAICLSVVTIGRADTVGTRTNIRVDRSERAESQTDAGWVGSFAAVDEMDAHNLDTLYRFSGVTDDGEKGSPNRKVATAILCTNVDPANSAQVEVQVFPKNGVTSYASSVNMPPGQTFTFSTQDTAVYFVDAILGGGTGTDAISQGFGQVSATHSLIICTAHVLDPLSNPPTFVTNLQLYR